MFVPQDDLRLKNERYAQLEASTAEQRRRLAELEARCRVRVNGLPGSQRVWHARRVYFMFFCFRRFPPCTAVIFAAVLSYKGPTSMDLPFVSMSEFVFSRR